VTTVQEVRLGDLVPAVLDITRGFPTHRAVPEGDVRVMSVAAMRNATPPRYFADRTDITESALARPGDVLVAIEGGTVGETLVVPDGLEEFVPSQQAATLRVHDRSRLDPWYLGAWLSADPAGEQLRRLARGLGIQRIPIKELSSLIVRVPPLDTQRAIGERFQAFEMAIRSHRAVGACLEELRDLDLVVTFADPNASGQQAGGHKGAESERITRKTRVERTGTWGRRTRGESCEMRPEQQEQRT
jgi:hypothetical protein